MKSFVYYMIIFTSFIIFFILSSGHLLDQEDSTDPLDHPLNHQDMSLTTTRTSPSAPFLSIIILTYNKPQLVKQTLSTLLMTSLSSEVVKLPWRFEVLLVDNGCFSSTREVVKKYTQSESSAVKYIPLCNNTHYSLANNLAVSGHASSSSKWLLFLNDDVIPQHYRNNKRKQFYGSSFLWNFHSLISVYDKNLSENMFQYRGHDVGAVGCKMMFGSGAFKHRIIEAGSSILANGKTTNYLR